MNTRLLKQYIQEAMMVSPGFIDHLRNGLAYADGEQYAESRQIIDDWLEEVELARGDLLHPGRVTQMERYAAKQWPAVLEQYRGNKNLALIALSNMLDAKLDELESET